MNKPRYVKITGHPKRLILDSLCSTCGDIKNGVAFEFEGEGGWVVDLDDLAQIVKDAMAFQSGTGGARARSI